MNYDLSYNVRLAGYVNLLLLCVWSVLIGPGCSGDLTVASKLATYYELPQVTGVGDLVLGKDDYPTLTRLSYSLEKQSGESISEDRQTDRQTDKHS